MNKQPLTSKSGALSRLFKTTFSAGLLTASVLLLSGHTSQAGSATWKLNPVGGDWNTAANWTPSTVPNGPADTAMFGVSNTTNVTLTANTEVDSIVFDVGANAFTISTDISSVVTISGAGITNDSGVTQNFFLPGGDSSRMISFINGATAARATFINNPPTAVGQSPPTVYFGAPSKTKAAVVGSSLIHVFPAIPHVSRFSATATLMSASNSDQYDHDRLTRG